MVVLEDRKRLMSLLELTVQAEDVQIFLGEGDLAGGQSDLLANGGEALTPGVVHGSSSPATVIASSFGKFSADPEGALGVLGPARMDYSALVPLVRAMARAMSC